MMLLFIIFCVFVAIASEIDYIQNHRSDNRRA